MLFILGILLIARKHGKCYPQPFQVPLLQPADHLLITHLPFKLPHQIYLSRKLGTQLASSRMRKSSRKANASYKMLWSRPPSISLRQGRSQEQPPSGMLLGISALCRQVRNPFLGTHRKRVPEAGRRADPRQYGLPPTVKLHRATPTIPTSISDIIATSTSPSPTSPKGKHAALAQKTETNSPPRHLSIIAEIAIDRGGKGSAVS